MPLTISKLKTKLRMTQTKLNIANRKLEQMTKVSRSLSVRFYNHHDALAFMGGEFPQPDAKHPTDVQWVKLLRQRSGCGLKEAVNGHKLCMKEKPQCQPI